MIKLLTVRPLRIKINSPSPHVEVGIGVPESHGIGRKHAVFLCVKSQFIIMSSWIEQLKNWLGRVSSTPILPMLGSIIGVMQSCFKIKHTEAVMPKIHTTNLSNKKTLTLNVSKKSQSRFNVLTKSGQSIARKVPFSKAITLKSKHPEFTIKFDSMEGVA